MPVAMACGTLEERSERMPGTAALQFQVGKFIPPSEFRLY